MPPKSQYFAAIDGGGTHTRVRIARGDGSSVAEVVAAQTVKVFDVGLDESVRRITALLVRAATKARAERNRITALCVGLAGNGRDSDQRRLRRHLAPALCKARFGIKRIRMESDATIALYGLLHETSGVVLICGTGAIAMGRTSRNEIVRVGGWGRIVGDEGSGYWIGAQALNAVGRNVDGRGPDTTLTEAVFASFTKRKNREPRFLRSAIALGTLRVESIAPLVSSCAEKGDKIASAILRRAADELFYLLAAMHRGHFRGGKNVPLAFHGSVLERSSVGPMLKRTLQHELPGAFAVTQSAATPLDGAMRLLLR